MGVASYKGSGDAGLRVLQVMSTLLPLVQCVALAACALLVSASAADISSPAEVPKSFAQAGVEDVIAKDRSAASGEGVQVLSLRSDCKCNAHMFKFIHPANH